MNKNEFKIECLKLGIEITDEIISDLDKYLSLILEWNQKVNLTAITVAQDVYLKHFYDSLCLSKAINLNENLLLCDIGTGAGFPGIVLKIVYRNLNIILLEPIKKRCDFLNIVIEKLNLKNIEVINERAEIYSKINREKFDIVTCRAVSHLGIISELAIPMLKTDGYFLPLKGKVEEEINESKNILKRLDSKIEEIIEYNLPFEESKRSIIKIKKLKKTNERYPRNYSQIKNDFSKKK